MPPIDPFPAGLLAALRDAVGAAGLLAATVPPPAGAVERIVARDDLRIDGRLLGSSLPRVSLRLGDGADAAGLAATWGIADPIAVSPDVHQSTWHLAVRGEPLVDPYATRVVAGEVLAGCWVLRGVLDGRPPGPLPGIVAGASPAYPLAEGACRVVRIEVARRPLDASLLTAAHADAVVVLEAARRRQPHARPGWTPAGSTPFLVVRAGGAPAAGAALDIRDGLGLASAIALDPAAPDAASVAADLVDALETVALAAGATTLRLDGTAFLANGPLRLAARGYVVGPPYEGDADVEVWAERRLSVGDAAQDPPTGA